MEYSLFQSIYWVTLTHVSWLFALSPFHGLVSVLFINVHQEPSLLPCHKSDGLCCQLAHAKVEYFYSLKKNLESYYIVLLILMKCLTHLYMAMKYMDYQSLMTSSFFFLWLWVLSFSVTILSNQKTKWILLGIGSQCLIGTKLGYFN